MIRSLALDQGTTSTKAYVAEGAAWRLLGTRTHRQIRPRPGWVEHDAAEILANLRELAVAAGPVDAVALANQGETVVAWDAHTKAPLHNAIVWQDERTADALARLRAAGAEALTTARAGLPLDPYFSAAKLRWLYDHAEGAKSLHRQGRLRLGTSDAFFLDALTGQAATDVSTASRTSLLDLRRLCWDADLCALFGVPPDCLPPVRSTLDEFGGMAGIGAMRAAIVDQQASLFGHGCSRPGELKITFGTGAFALGVAPSPDDPPAGLLPTCAWRLGRAAACYALDGGILTAGSAVDWARGVGLHDAAAPVGHAAARDVFFVPAQSGLGAPHWDRSARGAWFGLGLDCDRATLGAAVLEGVALRAAQVVRAFAAAHPVGRVSVDGGMTRLPGFVAFLAACLDRPVLTADTADLTAIGLLRLCALATGGDEPVTEWTQVEASSRVPERIHARFADAVARAKGWLA